MAWTYIICGGTSQALELVAGLRLRGSVRDCCRAAAVELGLFVHRPFRGQNEWLPFALYYTRVYYNCLRREREREREREMAHTTKDKAKLLSRVRRIRGQVEAIERALDGEHACSSVLQLMAACRGALNGLMAEVVEGHIRFHILDPKSGENAPQMEAAEELIDVVWSYLK
jgi:DNA-binding FrmR family transcriptional regulator